MIVISCQKWESGAGWVWFFGKMDDDDYRDEKNLSNECLKKMASDPEFAKK